MNLNENLLKNFRAKTVTSPKKIDDSFTCFNKISPKLEEPIYVQKPFYQGFRPNNEVNYKQINFELIDKDEQHFVQKSFR